jgi:hypothetical protein
MAEAAGAWRQRLFSVTASDLGKVRAWHVRTSEVTSLVVILSDVQAEVEQSLVAEGEVQS